MNALPDSIPARGAVAVLLMGSRTVLSLGL